jgi:hypothetical protein
VKQVSVISEQAKHREPRTESGKQKTENGKQKPKPGIGNRKGDVMKPWNACRLLMVLMLCLVTGNAGAVVIKGTVSDTLTAAKVESVLVTVKGTATQAYTNAQGVFTLNTTSNIRDHRVSVPALAWTALREAEIKVYDVNGTYRETGRTNDLTGLPDGIYLIETGENGQVYTGKMIKMHEQYQAGDFVCVAAKAAAAVTLVYTHKYYNTKESAATEGDTGVITKIKLLPPGPATTGPRTTSLVNMTPLEALIDD